VDDNAQLELYKRIVRRRYANTEEGIAALQAALTTLEDSELELAAESVDISQMGFEGGQASGNPNDKRALLIQAMTEVLCEYDPDLEPDAPDSTRFADFSASHLQT
jgi:hypothetical protein